jgi:cbb3-type cytochrome oxidase maturation protein
VSILYVLVPVALGIVLVAVGAYVWSVKSGQFDDLETPAVRPLIEDDEGPEGGRQE